MTEMTGKKFKKHRWNSKRTYIEKQKITCHSCHKCHQEKDYQRKIITKERQIR